MMAGAVLGVGLCLPLFYETRFVVVLFALPVLLFRKSASKAAKVDMGTLALYGILNLFVFVSILYRGHVDEFYKVLFLVIICSLVFFHGLHFGKSASIPFFLLLVPFTIVTTRILFARFVAGEIDPQSIISGLDSSIIVVPNDYAIFLVLLPLFGYCVEKYVKSASAVLLPMIWLVTIFTSIVLSSSLCVVLWMASVLLMLKNFRSSIGNRILLVLGAAFCASLIALIFGAGAKLAALPTSRLPVWDAALHQAMDFPLVGAGLDSFRDYYAGYIERVSYHERILVDTRQIPWAHNLFLDFAVTFGIPSSAVLIALYFYLTIGFFRQNGRLEYAVFVSMVLYFIAAMTEFTHLRVYPIIFAAYFAGIYATLDSRKSTQE